MAYQVYTVVVIAHTLNLIEILPVAENFVMLYGRCPITCL